MRSERPLAQFDLEHLELIAGADVVGIRQDHAAFQPGANLVDIVLEAPQAGDGDIRQDRPPISIICKSKFDVETG